MLGNNNYNYNNDIDNNNINDNIKNNNYNNSNGSLKESQIYFLLATTKPNIKCYKNRNHINIINNNINDNNNNLQQKQQQNNLKIIGLWHHRN